MGKEERKRVRLVEEREGESGVYGKRKADMGQESVEENEWQLIVGFKHRSGGSVNRLQVSKEPI